MDISTAALVRYLAKKACSPNTIVPPKNIHRPIGKLQSGLTFVDTTPPCA